MTIRADAGALVEFLDSRAKIDPVAMGRLVAHRVPCNDILRDHPSVQVGTALDRRADGFEHCMASPLFPGLGPDDPVVGFLGVLNGYAGTYDAGKFEGWGPISATVEDDGSVSGFKLTAPLGGSC